MLPINVIWIVSLTEIIACEKVFARNSETDMLIQGISMGECNTIQSTNHRYNYISGKERQIEADKSCSDS